MKILIIITFFITLNSQLFAQCDSISSCVEQVNKINSPLIDIQNCKDKKVDNETEQKEKLSFKKESLTRTPGNMH